MGWADDHGSVRSLRPRDGSESALRASRFLCVCVCVVRARARVRVCACVCARARVRVCMCCSLRCVYIYIAMCVCVCLCGFVFVCAAPKAVGRQDRDDLRDRLVELRRHRAQHCAAQRECACVRVRVCSTASLCVRACVRVCVRESVHRAQPRPIGGVPPRTPWSGPRLGFGGSAAPTGLAHRTIARGRTNGSGARVRISGIKNTRFRE